MIRAGLDIAFKNDYMALAIVEKKRDEIITLVHLWTWKKARWQSWKEDMVSKSRRFQVGKVYADQTNNQSVIMELQNLGIQTEGLTFTNQSKSDMILNLQKLLATGVLVFPVAEKISSPVQRRLFEELVTQMEEQEFVHDSANPKLTHPSGQHDDLLWALCLAVHKTASEQPIYAVLFRAK